MLADSLLYNATQPLEYRLNISDSACNSTTHPFVVEHWVEDLYGNVLKEKSSSSDEILCQKTKKYQWTPPEITGSEAYLLKANITEPYCNDPDASDNFNERVVVVKGRASAAASPPSAINITDVLTGSDGKVKYGEVFSVKVEVYRGDTDKYAVYAYVENSAGTKLSETTKFHAKSKNTAYVVQLPVAMKANCQRKYAGGSHTLVVEGLGVEDRHSVYVEGLSSSACQFSASSAESTCVASAESPSARAAESQGEWAFLEYYPRKIFRGEEFETFVRVENSGDGKEKYAIYSYVFNRSWPLSEGFDGEKWSSAWDANKKEFSVEPHSSKTIVLKNRIMKNISGSYSYRVRLKGEKRKKDFTVQVNISRRPSLPCTEKERGNISAGDARESITSNTLKRRSFHIRDVFAGIAAWIKSLFSF